jgi:hypothetical protein
MGENDEPAPEFDLPWDYGAQVAEFLPVRLSWSPELEIWGYVHSDDIQIWSEEGKVVSVRARVDVRKLDDVLLSRLLELADRWELVMVESRYRRVCRMDVRHLRALIAGDPRNRAIKEPEVWIPLIAEEIKRREREE